MLPVRDATASADEIYVNDATGARYNHSSFLLRTASADETELHRDQVVVLMREIRRDLRESELAALIARTGSVHGAVSAYVAHHASSSSSPSAAASPSAVASSSSAVTTLPSSSSSSSSPRAEIDYFDRTQLGLNATLDAVQPEGDNEEDRGAVPSRLWPRIGIAASAASSGPTASASASSRTMNTLLLAHAASVRDYLAPEVGVKKIAERAIGFNDELLRLANNPVFGEPFTVTINVGDLKGFGDIAAGAKLARELKDFYARFEEWQKVSVELYLHKLDTLKTEEKHAEIESIKKLVANIIGSSGVHLHGDTPNALAEGPQMSLSYPAHNAPGDRKVTQYGYNRLDFEHGFGSGPGFGSLGVLAIDPNTQEEAIARADDPGASVDLSIVEGLSRAYQIRKTHFAYFSVSKKQPASFAKKVCAALEGNTAIVFAKLPLDKPIATVAASISALPMVGDMIMVTVTGGAFNIEERKNPKAAKSAHKVLLINFASTLANVDMLSMYYKSDGVVGATGDQSFMEAYAMRRAKNRSVPSKGGADILYDVVEQQRHLYGHLGELQTGTYRDGMDGEGLKEVRVDENISAALDAKLLKYPVIMMINDAILEAARPAEQ